jgi:hypothetical protein
VVIYCTCGWKVQFQNFRSMIHDKTAACISHHLISNSTCDNRRFCRDSHPFSQWRFLFNLLPLWLRMPHRDWFGLPYLPLQRPLYNKVYLQCIISHKNRKAVFFYINEILTYWHCKSNVVHFSPLHSVSTSLEHRGWLPDMAGSCEFVKKAVGDNRQG